ncbi:unnamed protein product, partial [Ectocarpus sp. 12 AP-2014]
PTSSPTALTKNRVNTTRKSERTARAPAAVSYLQPSTRQARSSSEPPGALSPSARDQRYNTTMRYTPNRAPGLRPVLVVVFVVVVVSLRAIANRRQPPCALPPSWGFRLLALGPDPLPLAADA